MQTDLRPAAPASARIRPLRFGLMPALPLAILILMILAAVAAPLITQMDPVRSNLRSALLPPFFIEGGSMEHPLGTDGFGRDVLSRVLYGARVSLSVAGLALLIATSIGTVLGLLSGWVGGWVDSVIMRFVDMVLAVPTILVALALAIALGPSFAIMVTVLGLLIWPRIARILRGETLLIRQEDYVRLRARRRGALAAGPVPTRPAQCDPDIAGGDHARGRPRDPRRGVVELPGRRDPAAQPSWGGMISDGRALISTGWWIALFPGLAIVLTVLAFNALGDWLRDHFDPRLRDV